MEAVPGGVFLHRWRKYYLCISIKKITQHIIIRRITGIFIAVTLLLSITPKQALHFLAAGHTDQSTHRTGSGEQLHAAAFHCDCNSVVATSPFIETKLFTPLSEVVINHFIVDHTSEIYYRTNYFSPLRGPPAFI
jgi:hypothetical protein